MGGGDPKKKKIYLSLEFTPRMYALFPIAETLADILATTLSRVRSRQQVSNPFTQLGDRNEPKRVIH